MGDILIELLELLDMILADFHLIDINKIDKS